MKRSNDLISGHVCFLLFSVWGHICEKLRLVFLENDICMQRKQVVYHA